MKSRSKILVVEDERVVAEDIAEIIKSMGHKVVGLANNVERAIEMAEAERPDLILVDIKLRSAKDGVWAATEIRKRIGRPMVYLTAHSEPDKVERAKTSEPVGYIVKPFTPEALRTTIEIALERVGAEDLLRMSNDSLTTLLRCMNDAVVSCDLEGHALYLNQAAKNMLYPASWEEARVEVNGQEIPLSTWALNLMPGEGRRDSPILLTSHPPMPIGLCIQPLHDDGGVVTGRLLLLKDATLEHQDRARERQYREKLDSLHKLRTDLLHRMLQREKLTSAISQSFLREDEGGLEAVMTENMERLSDLFIMERLILLQLKDDGCARKICSNNEAAGCAQRLRSSTICCPDTFMPSDQVLELREVIRALPGLVRIMDPQKERPKRAYALHLDNLPKYSYLLIAVDWSTSDPLTSAEKDAIRGMTSFFVSRLEHKEAQDERDAFRQQLFHAQKLDAIGQLSGGIAHDFNNLLMPILGYCDLIREDRSLVHEGITEIVRAAESARKLTRQLLAFSRKEQEHKEVLDLVKVVSNLQMLLRRLLDEQVEITFDLPKAPAWINADVGQLEQVLMNLVVNARDAMLGGGQISVHCHAGPETNKAVLIVSDTGIGIPQEVQTRIFDPFFSTKGKKGTGLGLSVVYGIVQQHGGDIQLESNEGIGTTFRMVFPIVEAPQTCTELEETIQSGPVGSQLVLLVEDERAVRDYMKHALGRRGYQVASAKNMKEARRQFAEADKVDFVLCDAILPDGQGLNLMEEFRVKQPGLPFLLSSGHTHVILDDASCQPDAFLQKPFNLKELDQVLAGLQFSSNTKIYPEGELWPEVTHSGNP